MSRPYSSESVYRAIADPTRRRLIDVLRRGPRTIVELLDLIPLKRPFVSYHLNILRQAGVLKQRRRGRERVYSLDQRTFRSAHQWISRCLNH